MLLVTALRFKLLVNYQGCEKYVSFVGFYSFVKKTNSINMQVLAVSQ